MSRIPLWWLIVIVLVLSVCGSGCGSTRAVLVPDGEPVQIAEPVRAYIYVVVNGQRIKSSNKVILPAGYWCLPDPGE